MTYHEMIVRVRPDYGEDAVLWSATRTFADGFVWGGSGTCRTKRQARAFIRAQYDRAQRAHAAWLDRPTHTMLKDGELQPIVYADQLARP